MNIYKLETTTQTGWFVLSSEEQRVNWDVNGKQLLEVIQKIGPTQTVLTSTFISV